ncbi:MAG: glycosyltransferase family 4 protein [Hydrogenophaga sp.]|uniref:glycosyltransferase family 4 protein n=1 Tax=Hydrogenophaga sp. TaxID=1904254 RepID=UPI002AB8AB5D|nr:glycosyltransferase family 4 protein [Hydrogenophaga sp.]MDZ4104136.1 glycosyltransferase family 4 protein [Hydrogenophaga sp.]
MKAPNGQPAIVVFSSLFPSPAQPNAGVFVRERMFRVGVHVPLQVVAPTAWFPFQSLLRRWRPHFRPTPPAHCEQQGFLVWYPRYLSFPGVLKSLDGFFMAVGAYPKLRRLKREDQLDVIDAHFGYPDGYAAVLLGRWLKVPVTITMRGTEDRHSRSASLAPLLRRALVGCQQIFSVSDALKQVAVGLGVPGDKVEVVGNGVDAQKFHPMDRAECRQALGIPVDARVLISVGGLVERKGFHRVIEVLPSLIQSHPTLVYLIVGGPSAEGDNRAELEAQVAGLGLTQHVRFLGTRKPEELSAVLSAADVFVLPTRNEGWANVFLEAMACGLPVITTDVGGNREVVCKPELGAVLPFGDSKALAFELNSALLKQWDSAEIRNYAENNAWDERVVRLLAAFRSLSEDGKR